MGMLSRHFYPLCEHITERAASHREQRSKLREEWKDKNGGVACSCLQCPKQVQTSAEFHHLGPGTWPSRALVLLNVFEDPSLRQLLVCCSAIPVQHCVSTPWLAVHGLLETASCVILCYSSALCTSVGKSLRLRSLHTEFASSTRVSEPRNYYSRIPIVWLISSPYRRVAR